VATVKLSLTQFASRMGKMRPHIEQAIVGGLRAYNLLSLRTSKNEFFLGGSGPPHPTKLTSRTGRLRSSIRVIEPRKRSGVYESGLKAGGPGVPYAAIHEFGGRTRPHKIVPRKAKVLSWRGKSGARQYARSVNHPGSNIPARPYLVPALEKNLKQLEKQLAVAIEVAFAEGLRG
jgi:phage gpG-like protein